MAAAIPISFEFFPPKTSEGTQKLRAVREQLYALKPEFFSVTYGAGGSTQEGTLQTVQSILQDGYAAAPHLSCIGATRASVREQLAAQQSKVRARVVDALSSLHKKCAEWTDDNRIHQSTLDAVAELADVIPGLLITDDPSLVEVCKDASRAMRGVDRDLIRDSGHARASVAEKAAELLKKLGFAQ